MKAPKKFTWIIALILGVLGFVSRFVNIPYVSPYAFWYVFAGYILLLFASSIKSL